MRRTLGQLLPALDAALAAREVVGVTADSRQVRPGWLFVAVPGLTVDGHDFAAAAADAGAVAVVAERALVDLGAPCLVVESTARELGLIAARLHGEPGKQLSLIGLTGTNGKTTTSYLIEGMLAAAGLAPGVIGTVSYRFAGQETAAPFTTPTPEILQRLLAEMVAAGCSHVAVEVSSHALQLERVWGCPFAVAGFSHLSQDHLDLHGDMQRYLRAKLRLFEEHLQPGGTAVVNLDGQGADAVVRAVIARGDLRLLTCSRQGRRAPGADGEATLEGLLCDLGGLRGELRFDDESAPFSSPLLGAFNADNLLLAAACCHAAGVPLPRIAAGIAGQRPVPGRLERVDDASATEPTVLVDYAHTPDALARALGVLRPLCRGRLIAVFGCGGDRDRAKRPLMGEAVAQGADLALLTSDNPRSEDPEAIIAAVVPGLERGGAGERVRLDELPTADRGFAVEPDRRRAIRAAIAAASRDDVVLVAGKGHEDYQIVGDQRLHFDDREQARSALEEVRRCG